MERLQPQRYPGASPLFQVMFALQRSHLSGIADLAAFALGEAGARLEVVGLKLLSWCVEHRARSSVLVVGEDDVPTTTRASCTFRGRQPSPHRASSSSIADGNLPPGR